MSMESYGELEAGLPIPEISPIDPNCADYVTERRLLLGPSADISHPDFGKQNTKEQNYRLDYEITHPNGDTSVTLVIARIYDSEGNLIDDNAEMDHTYDLGEPR